MVKSFKLYYPYFVFMLFLSGCASSPTIQPQINSLVIAEKYNYAVDLLENTKEAYGPQNKLLYLLDYGLTLQMAGRYQDSIAAFEEAKKIYDDQYTISLTRGLGSWIVNDNVSAYHPEDFERVMVNVFQALNYASLNNIEEALVEARDVDRKLKLFNEHYERKNTYKEDGFARLLMGILYETSGAASDLDDAYISYKQALQTYVDDYEKFYGLNVPEVLQENILSLSKKIDQGGFNQYRKQFHQTKVISFDERSQKGEVYVIYYHGLSPIKHQVDIPIPLPNGLVTKLAFPVYDKRIFDCSPQMLQIASANHQVFKIPFEKVEDIGAIAVENLENRKWRVIGKAAVRAGLKVLAESAIEQELRRKYHNDASRYFSYVSSLYNIISEQADLRSWQTLPDDIQMGRTILDPGEYEVFINNRSLKKIHLNPRDKIFLIYRSNR